MATFGGFLKELAWKPVKLQAPVAKNSRMATKMSTNPLNRFPMNPRMVGKQDVHKPLLNWSTMKNPRRGPRTRSAPDPPNRGRRGGSTGQAGTNAALGSPGARPRNPGIGFRLEEKPFSVFPIFWGRIILSTGLKKANPFVDGFQISPALRAKENGSTDTNLLRMVFNGSQPFCGWF